LNAFTVAAGFVPIDTYATHTSLHCIYMRPRFFLACTWPFAANFAENLDVLARGDNTILSWL
jgi:hypothetical protein